MLNNQLQITDDTFWCVFVCNSFNFTQVKSDPFCFTILV